MEQVSWLVLSYGLKTQMEALRAKHFSTVPCPTCGVAVGQRCVLHSDALRCEPHIDRKLSAIEAMEAGKHSNGRKPFARGKSERISLALC